MAKIVILVGIISILMMQSASGALKINHYPDYVENVKEQQVIQSKLYVKGRAAGLENRDSWWAGQSDPYMEVTATDESGVTEKKKTNVVGGNRWPVWDNYLEFSNRKWKKITIDIWDDDGPGRQDDRLCGPSDIDLQPLGRSGENKKLVDCKHGIATVFIKFGN